MSTNIRQGQNQGQNQSTNFAQRQFAQQRGELCKSHNLAAEIRKILQEKQCFNVDVDDPRKLELESLDNYLNSDEQIFMGEIYSSSNESMGYKMAGDGLTARADVPEDRNKYFVEREDAINDIKTAIELLKCPPSYKAVGRYLADSVDEQGFISDPTSVYKAYMNEVAKKEGVSFNSVSESLLNTDDLKEVHQFFKDNLRPAGLLAQDYLDAVRAKILQNEDWSVERDIALNLLTKNKQELETCFRKDVRNGYEFDKAVLAELPALKKYISADGKLHEAVYDVIKEASKEFFEGNSVSAPSKSKKDVDFEVSVVDGKYHVEKLGMPKVFINKEHMREWERMSKVDKEISKLIKNEHNSLDYVESLLKSTKDVSEKIVTAILTEQKEYLETNDKNKINVLRNIDLAEKFDVDQSVVSNIINNKIVRMPNGEEFTLKEMMDRGVKAVSQGEEVLVSKGQIREIISDKISAEAIEEPITDKGLHNMFKQHGYNISVDMITRLREEAGLPDDKMRARVYQENPGHEKEALYNQLTSEVKTGKGL